MAKTNEVKGISRTVGSEDDALLAKPSVDYKDVSMLSDDDLGTRSAKPSLGRDALAGSKPTRQSPSTSSDMKDDDTLARSVLDEWIMEWSGGEVGNIYDMVDIWNAEGFNRDGEEKDIFISLVRFAISATRKRTPYCKTHSKSFGWCSDCIKENSMQAEARGYEKGAEVCKEAEDIKLKQARLTEAKEIFAELDDNLAKGGLFDAVMMPVKDYERIRAKYKAR